MSDDQRNLSALTFTKGVAMVELDEDQAQDKDYRYVGDLADYALVEELKDRGALWAAYNAYRREHPWWHRFKIGNRVWGLSHRWFCFCPWNGDTAWITLPFVYFGGGKMNIELRLGSYKYGVTFDIRWRWE